ncbi:MAG: hypothetical protein AABX85_02665 [Nanoarchaeota archaeon]
MASEYVRLSRQEVIYGQKNFLKAQLDVLDLVKHYLFFLKARKEEFILKIRLKNKLEETKNSIILFEKSLPRVYSAETEAKKKVRFEKESKEVSSLEQEIELIKQKLAGLQ